MSYSINKYTVYFNVGCPSNKDNIQYKLCIESHKKIIVEDILLLVNSFEEEYHEDMADIIHSKIGGKQKMIAVHQGVEIITERV